MSMTYEDRTRRIFDFLFAQADGLLRSYKKPEHLSDNRARDEINEMVEEINKDIPSSLGDASFDMLLKEVRSAVKRRHGASGWPTIKILTAATADALKEIDRKSDDQDVEEVMLGHIVDWYQKFGNCMPACGKPSRTHQLIKRGVLTAREAKFADFPMTKEDNEIAKSEPPSKKEIDHHIRVLARLRRVDEDTARRMCQEEGHFPQLDIQHKDLI